MRLSTEKLKSGSPFWKQKGSRVSDSSLSLRLIAHREEKFSYGLIVRKKAGNAVVRQKIKRRLRHALCRVKPLGAQCAIFFVSTAEPSTLSFDVLCQRVALLLQEAQKNRGHFH